MTRTSHSLTSLASTPPGRAAKRRGAAKWGKSYRPRGKESRASRIVRQRQRPVVVGVLLGAGVGQRHPLALAEQAGRLVAQGQRLVGPRPGLVRQAVPLQRLAVLAHQPLGAVGQLLEDERNA